MATLLTEDDLTGITYAATRADDARRFHDAGAAAGVETVAAGPLPERPPGRNDPCRRCSRTAYTTYCLPRTRS